MPNINDLLASCRLRSAGEFYYHVYEEKSFDVGIRYNLGAFHFCALGNGVEARQWFLAALTSEGPENAPPKFLACARENLMLLALSYVEYEEHACKLHSLDPGNPILRDHRAEVRRVREAGVPWHMVLGSSATRFHDPHHPQATDRFSECAATWQLLFENRHDLALPRQHRRFAAIGYAAALFTHMGRCGETMIKVQGWDDPGELTIMLRPALRLLQTALEELDNDSEIRSLLDMARAAMTMPPQRAKPVS